MARDQGAFAGHLLGVHLADAVHAVGLGFGELLAGVCLAVGFDAAGLGVAFSSLHTGHALGFGFQLALLDLALLEGQHVLHGFFLGARGNHLFARSGFGGDFAANLVCRCVQLGFLHALVLELQRVAHLLGGQFLGQQAVHAAAVFSGQVHLADLHAAKHHAIGREAGAQFGLDDLCDLGALGREDLPHRVAGEHLVDQALHCGCHDVAVHVVGQVARLHSG